MVDPFSFMILLWVALLTLTYLVIFWEENDWITKMYKEEDKE